MEHTESVNEDPTEVKGGTVADSAGTHALVEDEESVTRWRKIGGGTFRMGSGRIIKPNQVFSAKPSEIPEGAMKYVVQLSHVPDEEVIAPANLEYSLQVKSPGWYDIVDGLGKVINEKSLRELQAKEMLRSLGA